MSKSNEMQYLWRVDIDPFCVTAIDRQGAIDAACAFLREGDAINMDFEKIDDEPDRPPLVWGNLPDDLLDDDNENEQNKVVNEKEEAELPLFPTIETTASA